MLAAKFASLAAVVVGTTLGMLIVNVPVVLRRPVASATHPVPGDAHRRRAAVRRRLASWVLASALTRRCRDAAPV